MAMQISRKCEYALRAMMHMAGLEEGKLNTAKNISGAENIPLKFLEKILQALVAGGLLRVTYGPRGGYRLAREADEITFREIMEAVEGPMRLNRCVGDEPDCRSEDCNMRNYWIKFQDALVEMFDNTTLEEAISTSVKA